MVRFNKTLQKKLNINLINYRIFSGKYIVYEKGGIVKEYNSYNDGLMFEGEYKNGKRNGKGKEYNSYSNDNLLFEGEYIDGKRNGKGREYYNDGKIKFEGEFLLGKIWNGKGYDNQNKIVFQITNGEGYIKEYSIYGNIIFEGIYVNGEKNGKGKEYNFITPVLQFEGEYLNGKRYGKGKEYDYKSNLIFEGEYLNGKRWNGKGFNILDKSVSYELKNGKGFVKETFFECEFVNGERNGLAKLFSEGRLTAEIEYVNGKRNGKGKEYNRDGEVIFEGEYLYDYKVKGKDYINGKLIYEGEYFFMKKWEGKGYDENGKVIYELKNGTGPVQEYIGNYLSFEGEYLNGQKNGKCKEYSFDFQKSKLNLKFDGEYLNGKMNGYCKIYNYDGKLRFEGEYINGQKNGKVKEYNYDGKLQFEGEYLNDKKNGKVKEYYKYGKLEFEGEYLNGKKWNGKGYTLDISIILSLE